MTAPSTEPDLTFQWPKEAGFPFLLFFCAVGSLAAHTATFFLFQVVYPQRVTIPQPAPHVSLLTPSSPENIALLRWIEAEDPALIASDNSVTPPMLAEVRHRPSFATPRTEPLGAPEEKPEYVRFPPAVEQLGIKDSIQFSTPAAVSVGVPTLVHFDGALASRSLSQDPPLDPPRRVSSPVNPTVLLVGVSGDGEIRFRFLQQPSGDTALDEFAITHVSRLSFAPADPAMTWAHATFAWGLDAYAPENPKSE
jgi:hypothetical protein